MHVVVGANLFARARRHFSWHAFPKAAEAALYRPGLRAMPALIYSFIFHFPERCYRYENLHHTSLLPVRRFCLFVAAEWYQCNHERYHRRHETP